MKLIGYTRVSSESQEENTSLGEQEKRIRSYCDALQHDLINIYLDIASGSHIKRDGLQAALESVDDVDGIIILKLDRLSRSVQDTIGLIAKLNAKGKHLIAVEQHLDTSSSSGRLFVNIMASFSEYEREIINERTQGGRKAKHLSGGYAYGKPSFGMKSDQRELVIDDEEQTIIKIIKNHRRSGKSFYRIAQYLNENEILTKQGKAWHPWTVQRIAERK